MFVRIKIGEDPQSLSPVYRLCKLVSVSRKTTSNFNANSNENQNQGKSAEMKRVRLARKLGMGRFSETAARTNVTVAVAKHLNVYPLIQVMLDFGLAY